MTLILSLLGPNQALDPTSSPTFSGVKTNANVGTAGTGVTATEWGDGYTHTSVLTVSTTLAAITGGVAQALGNLVYTFPAGAIVVNEAYMSMAITQSEGNINADTPDVGIGTTQASGANATLSAVASTAEDIITGQTAADCNGTATVKTIDESMDAVVIESGDTRTVYFNVADTWAASGDSAAAIAGTIVLKWAFMN